MARVIDVNVSDLKVDFFVRRSLNDEHVLALAMIVEAGTDLTPITINEENQVIDGRHRLKAYELVGKKTISCEVKRDLSRGEQLMAALTANMGGSLPPSPQDIRLSIQSMLAAGVPVGTIRKGLPLPPSVSRRYCDDAQSHMKKARVLNAVEAVTDSEMSVAAAADKYGIDVEDLRAEIRGKKKKLVTDAYGLPRIKSEVANRYRSSSQHNAKTLKKLIDAVIDGDCSPKVVEGAIEVFEKYINQQLDNMIAWRNRLAAVKLNQEAAA